MRCNLTEKRIRDAKPGPKQYLLWDQRVRGLGVLINPKTPATFVLQYRTLAGKTRRVTLARTEEMTLENARHRAARELVRIRDGEPDPATRRAKVRETPTVAELWRRFETQHAPTRITNGRMTERTVKEYRHQMRKHILPAIGPVPVADVTRGDIEAIVAPLAGKVQHNRVLALVSRLFTLAEHWEWRPQRTNPARGIERVREEARDRVLSSDELAALASALIDLEEAHRPAVSAIRFAAVTGLRIKSEVLSIRWEDVAFDTGRLTLPKTKTGRRGHDLPSAARQIMADLPRINEWVFASRGGAPTGDRHTRTIFKKACRAAGLEDVRLHDLRRTVMTNAAMAGVGTHVLRDLLGHKTTAMADRYIRSVGSPVRDAREQIGAAMAAMMEGKSGEVVPLRRDRD